jgi:hypothetical protein
MRYAHYRCLVSTILLLVGCADSNRDNLLSRKIGTKCTVSFRRDALGMAATLPASPSGTSINGADMTMLGKLAGENLLEVLLVDSNGVEHLIPRDAILQITFENQ